ncbi:MAG: hypothetical protein RLY89_1509 [Bacteroidota bacterium]|jgi:tricorn protease
MRLLSNPKTWSILVLTLFQTALFAQNTRLLREPSISKTHVAFVYGADIWISPLTGGEAKRITSTAAVESDPHFSPDGKLLAFSSNRSGVTAVYIVSTEGGIPNRLTWYPEDAFARGFSPDGKFVLYASTRETAPSDYARLWTVPVNGGASTLLPAPWAYNGQFSANGKQLVLDRMNRWDKEWRNYRGGQNTALQILDLETLKETSLPNERSMDLQPLWMNNQVYFLSDRDFNMNIWQYDSKNASLKQVTKLKDTDVKWLSSNGKELAYEWSGNIYLLDPTNGSAKQINIEVKGDFPWAEPKWENVSSRATNASLSPTGKRILVEARGEIFTVPVENGDALNLSNSSGTADRQPLWSPDGRQIAWFSDEGGKGYQLVITDQFGKAPLKKISIGVSKLGWEPTWSPDGKWIAFVDDDVRIQVLELATGKIQTADIGGSNIQRGDMGISWSPDSKWLAYAKSGTNQFKRITVWNLITGKATPISDAMADAYQPAWDRDGRHLYFLASTNLALGSGWANTSSIQAKPSFGAYVTVLRKDDAYPFPLKSDDEPDSTIKEPKKPKDTTDAKAVKIDFEQIDRRTIALPIPVGEYDLMLSGPKGSVFIGAGPILSKFSLESKKLDEFAKGASQVYVSANGEKILFKSGPSWRVVATSRPPSPADGNVSMNLNMKLNRQEEWKQIFEETWRYERDYFYDPNMHGRNWQEVYERYAPLVPYIRHRKDLTYILDQVNGELSVGHSFVGGGDFPSLENNTVGVLGADLTQESGQWKIKRIYTTESWNPGLVAPLDQPGLKVQEGNYLLAIDGKALNANMDPFALLDGKAGKQTQLLINSKPDTAGAWTIKMQPIADEFGLRQRAWVEDNRRKVEELSKGKLGYAWVPNTGGPGFVSFNRYYFAQQDKEGMVIDERFNGGGLLDDYMVDLMARRLRAALTNEVPNGIPFQLPSGNLGPKALLINELAGSGGDFFPWVFQHQKIGPLIGTRTWGGLVKSSVHYRMIDGGTVTAPDNAVYDPVAQKWVAENTGVAPDIEQKIDAISVSKGRDLQLERAVQEVLRLIELEPKHNLKHPPYSKPAVKN